MLVELSVVEQRYHAVMEVLSAGIPVVEVAEHYGVSRKTVHAWIRRYRDEGLPGLTDRSHRPHHHPWQLDADIEAVLVEMRRAHPRWGPRRLVHELGKTGEARVPSLSTVYRVLKRHGLVTARPRKRRREDYLRWERPAPMQLWQMDIMGSVMLVDGRELKLISGVDDHSRYCVIATVVPRATSRAVCQALVTAMQTYGVPDEVLTDNGKQFTGKYGRPRPSEVLFDRICRHNGIRHLLTKVRSPTTTGKVERWHQTIQTDLLAEHGPFDDLQHARDAVEAWRTEYNTLRPHQSLDMTAPAERFQAAGDTAPGLTLWTPPDLAPAPPSDVEREPAIAEHEDDVVDDAPDPTRAAGDAHAVQIDGVVPTCGNVKVRQQQIWIGPRFAGQSMTLWIDCTTVHVKVDGQHLKTVPSRMTSIDIGKLRAAGATPAGPLPARPSAAHLAHGAPIEVVRVVNACGNVSVANQQFNVGSPWAGRRITIRLEDRLAHVIVDGKIVRTRPLTLSLHQRARLQGARAAVPKLDLNALPVRVQRRVHERGSTMVIGQKIHVGRPYAHQIVTIEIHERELRVFDQHGELAKTVARTSTKDVKRFKAYAQTGRVRH